MAPKKKVLVKGPAPSPAPASYSSSENETSSSDGEQPRNAKLPVPTTAGTPATAYTKTYLPQPAAAPSYDGYTDRTSDDNDSDAPLHPSRHSISDNKFPPSAAAKPDSSKFMDSRNGGASTSRKNSFWRLWTEQDEITILKELVVFQQKHGHEPTHQESGTFFHLVKNKIETEFNEKQLMGKLRKMKLKYKGMVFKRGNDGAEKVFTKPHDQALLHFGKKLWAGELKDNQDGQNNNVDGEVKGKKRLRSTEIGNKLESSKRQHNMTTNAVPAVRLVNAVNTSHTLLNNIVDQMESANTSKSRSYKIALGMLKQDKVKILEEKSKKLCVAEMKTYRIQLDLMEEILLALKEELES